MLSLSTPEYAVRRMVSAISSAIDSSVLRKSSNPMGSRSRRQFPYCAVMHHAWLPTPCSSEVDHDVAVRVERGARARRDHARRVVFLDDARAHVAARRACGEIRPVDDRRLPPAELGPEVHAAGAAGARRGPCGRPAARSGTRGRSGTPRPTTRRLTISTGSSSPARWPYVRWCSRPNASSMPASSARVERARRRPAPSARTTGLRSGSRPSGGCGSPRRGSPRRRAARAPRPPCARRLRRARRAAMPRTSRRHVRT